MIKKHPRAGTLFFLQRTVSAQVHLLGCFAAIIGTFFLVQRCTQHSTINHVCACLIFGITSIFLFATSSIYHFLYDGFQITSKLEEFFERLDHIAIYLFIAGTYTAVLMNSVSDSSADILLVVVWTVAILGSLYTLAKHQLPPWAQHRFVYTGLFLLMGFIFLVRIGYIVEHLSRHQLLLFGCAALSYVVGAIVYATKRPALFKNYFGFHELWHLLVVVGYGFHYFFILGFY